MSPSSVALLCLALLTAQGWRQMCDWRQVNHSEVERESSDFHLSFTIHRGWNEDIAIDEHYNASDDDDEDGGGNLQVVINVFSLLGPISLKIEGDPGLGKPHTIR